MMKKQVLFLALAATLGAAPAHAIYINDHAFVANGGDMSNVQGTYVNVFDKLKMASGAPQFDTVGELLSCYATWLGVEGDYAWVLTSASCVSPHKPNKLAQPLAEYYNFKTYKMGDTVAVGGAGAMSFVHPNQFARPVGVGLDGTNIALVRLKLFNRDLAPVRGALLHDGYAEIDQRVTFVARGEIGVNSTKINDVPNAIRRARGESIIDGADDAGYTLLQGYEAGSATRWAQVQPSDRGSAWWQQHDGRWQVVATTSGGVAQMPKGIRTSSYASWINDLFPAARLASEGNAAVIDGAEITNTGYFSVNFGRHAMPKVSAGQPGVIVSGSIAGSAATITVPVTNVETGVTGTVVLNSSRPVHVGNNGLVVKFDSKNNPTLPPGVWTGRVNLDFSLAQDPIVKNAQLDIAVTGAPKFGFDYRSKNLATASQSVYFTVPTQATASGPTTGFRTSKLGVSILTVQGRDAITQQPVTLKLRAQRVRGTCIAVEMNNAMPCASNQSSELRMWFDPIDNPSLAYGTRYAAKFNVQARSFGNLTVNQTFPVSVDVNLMP